MIVIMTLLIVGVMHNAQDMMHMTYAHCHTHVHGLGHVQIQSEAAHEHTGTQRSDKQHAVCFYDIHVYRTHVQRRRTHIQRAHTHTHAKTRASCARSVRTRIRARASHACACAYARAREQDNTMYGAMAFGGERFIEGPATLKGGIVYSYYWCPGGRR